MASWWAAFRSLFRMKISHQHFEISSKMRPKATCRAGANYDVMIIIMTEWLQLWRNAFFKSLTPNFSGKERDTDIIILVLESTRLMPSSGVFISITGQNKWFSRISRKVLRRWKRLDEQNSDPFWERKYVINFMRHRRKCDQKQYAEQAPIMVQWL